MPSLDANCLRACADKYRTFVLGSESCAISVLKVREIKGPVQALLDLDRVLISAAL